MTDELRLAPEDELPSELAGLLRAERDTAGPGGDVAERVLGRLEQTLALPPLGGGPGGGGPGGGGPGDGGPGGGGPPPTSLSAAGVTGVTAAVGIGKATATAAVGLALGVGAAVGAAGHSVLVPPPAPSVEVRTIVSVVRVVAAPSALPESAPSLPSVVAGTSAGGAKPKVVVAPSNPAARDRALAEENALIARAQAALSRGNIAQARAALQEHARRFPSGQLQEERKLLERYAAAPEQEKP